MEEGARWRKVHIRTIVFRIFNDEPSSDDVLYFMY